MKKITLFVCALTTVVTAFATTPRAYQTHNASRNEQMKAISIEPEKPAAFKNVEDAKDDEPLLWVRSFAPNAFHYGSNSNGAFYYTPAWYVTPYMESLKLYNVEGLKSSWILNDADSTVLASDAASYALPLENGIGYYYGLAPLMRTPAIPGTDKDTIVPDYQYGKGGIIDWADAAGKTPDQLEQYKGVINADPYFNPMTLCNIYTEDTVCPYFPFDYGTFGAASGGDYWYGTKRTNNYISTDEEIKYFDTIAVFISNPGVMYIDNIRVGVWTKANSGADMFPGDDDHVRLTIYPLDAKGNPDWTDPLASATAGLAQLAKGTTWNDFLKFNFLEEDPITGNSDTVPAIVEGDFAIVFDEFNDGTAAFGFLSDGYSDYDNLSETYFYFYYPPYGRIVSTQAYRTPANLLVNIVGFMPTVVNAPEVVEFKKGEALTQEIVLQTNTWGEDYDIEADEWISVEAETVYDETTEEHAYAVKLTITVEASEEARLGQIDIEATGYNFSIIVNQNEHAQAIDNVNFKNDGKSYNVLGIEVGEDYKGIVIRNGEKFVR